MHLGPSSPRLFWPYRCCFSCPRTDETRKVETRLWLPGASTGSCWYVRAHPARAMSASAFGSGPVLAISGLSSAYRQVSSGAWGSWRGIRLRPFRVSPVCVLWWSCWGGVLASPAFTGSAFWIGAPVVKVRCFGLELGVVLDLGHFVRVRCQALSCCGCNRRDWLRVSGRVRALVLVGVLRRLLRLVSCVWGQSC